MATIAEFTNDELNIWHSENCAGNNLSIVELDNGSFSVVDKDDKHVGTFTKGWDRMVRELECMFAWSVSI